VKRSDHVRREVALWTCCLVLAAIALMAAPGASDNALAQSAPSVEKLVEQVRVAITHATFSLNAADLGPRLLHAHHVVNILEGAQGPHYDAEKGNPGDGYGALNYAADVAQAGGARANLAENALTYLQWADEEAVRATASSDFAAAGKAIHRALAYLSAALGRPGEEGSAASALALLEAEGDLSAPEVTIEIYNFRFGDGEPLVIRAGTTVTWINHDSAPHTATGSAFHSGTLGHGDTYSFTFTEPGVYEYVCAFHPHMTHTIIVQ